MIASSRLAAGGIGIAAGLLVTVGLVDGGNNEASPTPTTTSTAPVDGTELDSGTSTTSVVVRLSCVGIDSPAEVTFRSAEDAGDVVRWRLTDLAADVESGDAPRAFDDVQVDVERCDDIVDSLTDAADRWPCLLASELLVAGHETVEQLVEVLALDCEVGAAEE